MSNLGDDLDRLALLTKREEILARRLAETKDKRLALERDTFDRMVDEGWEPGKSSLNRNGFKFRPNATEFAIVQDAEQLRSWLLQEDGDELADAGLVEDKFKKGELNRIVRAKLDNNEPLPPGLGYYTKTSIHKSGIMEPKTTEEPDEQS